MSPKLRLRGAHVTRYPALEDFVVSTLSLLVIMVAIAVVFMPPRPQLAVAIAPIAPAATPQRIIEIYGSLVDQNGNPIQNATVTIEYKNGTKARSDITDANGDFYFRFNEGPAPYLLTVSFYDSSGQLVTGSTWIDAAPGMQWGMQVTYVPPSNWVFVPLPGY